MSMKMSKHAYKQLIQENIDWLMMAPDCLERQHIIKVLQNSISTEYPSKPSQDDKAVRLDGLSLVMTETGGGSYRLIFEFDNIEAMQEGRDKLAKIINQ